MYKKIAINYPQVMNEWTENKDNL